MERGPRWRYRPLYLAEEAISEVASLLGVPAAPHFDEIGQDLKGRRNRRIRIGLPG